jgi:dienelactone hydrolase
MHAKRVPDGVIVRDVEFEMAGGRIPATFLRVEDSVARPLVIFSNGLTAERHEAIPPGIPQNRISPPLVSALLTAGYNVLVPENPLHGERKPEGRETIDLLRSALARDAHAFLGQVFSESRRIIDGASEQGLVAPGAGIAAIGHSWGGLQSVLRFLGDPRVMTAVAIIPVVDPTSLEQFRLLRDATGRDGTGDLVDWLAGEFRRAAQARPIEFIVGGDDDIAPAAVTRTFAAALRAGPYADFADRLGYVEMLGVGHAFDEREVDEMLSWLKRFA